MKLVSWNVNGLRAAIRNGFSEWFEKEGADLVCLQEIKCIPDQIEEGALSPKYHSFWHSAEKAGYSGVAIFAKKEPLSLSQGLGVPEIDREGRVLVAEYSDFTLINAYFPNSQRDHARLPYKLSFCKKMKAYTDMLKAQGKNVILCGDLNIAHKEIDLKNPKSNEKNAGFLPEERAWMDEYLASGYVDTFRKFNPDPGHYSWWSYRPGVREKNIGWRLDYFVTNEENQDRLKRAEIHPHIRGSDHCPVFLELRD